MCSVSWRHTRKASGALGTHMFEIWKITSNCQATKEICKGKKYRFVVAAAATAAT